MIQRIANIIFKIDLQYTNLNQFRLDVVKSNCGFWSFLIFNLWIWSLFATFSPLLQNFFETFLWCILPLCFPGIWPAPGLHKLWYPGIRDMSTWSKFGAHGEHGDVFLFSNLGALWFSENLIRYSLHICLREVKNNLFSFKNSYLRHFSWRF